MMCDGSGELRYGSLCRGCDACLGLTTPRFTAPANPQPRMIPACACGCGQPRTPWCNEGMRIEAERQAVVS